MLSSCKSLNILKYKNVCLFVERQNVTGKSESRKIKKSTSIVHKISGKASNKGSNCVISLSSFV